MKKKKKYASMAFFFASCRDLVNHDRPDAPHSTAPWGVRRGMGFRHEFDVVKDMGGNLDR